MSERMITLRNGHKIWSRTVEGGPGIPLLLLHGGPGAGHDYLEPLRGLAAERPVIFYDQLGCGRSDKPDNRALWTIERFADEIDEVRDALGLHTCHVLGQSWGGWLGIEYMLRQPKGLVSFVLASTSASIPQFAAECERLIEGLPEALRRKLACWGARGAYDHPEYLEAADAFYARHVCRLPEWPECMQRTARNLDHNVVYDTINGPNEFTTIGNLRYWNRIPDLHRITLPVLITYGGYDELGEACATTLNEGIAGSRKVMFANSAHVAHIEEAEAYLACVADFLRKTEAARQG